MFTILFKDFVKYNCFANFNISFMPGITIYQMLHLDSKCIINVDDKTAYVFSD